MVRPPSVDSNGMKKGAWSEEEDNKLRDYVVRYGHWNWRLLPKYAGLARCGKSCRLRWVNYLKPGVKRGKFSKEEEDIVTKLHSQIGNKWSVIAAKLPGRTDNEVKNFYHTRIEKKKVRAHATVSETSLDSSTQESSRLDTCDTSSRQTTQPEKDLWSDLFQPSDQTNDRFPALMEEDQFFYPYSELSCSDSSYMSPLGWIADHDDHSNISSQFVDPSLWDESTSVSNTSTTYQHGEVSNEVGGWTYDPLMFDHCFDYGMDLFS